MNDIEGKVARVAMSERGGVSEFQSRKEMRKLALASGG